MTEEALTIKTLEDWARAGAHWRVVHHGERHAVVELQQCTGESRSSAWNPRIPQ
jgi:hypothetical protein